VQVIPASGLNWGFTATDLLNNSVSLYSSVAGFIILILAVMFAPKLVRFIKSVVGSGGRR
jgi:hypothetical protein